MAALGFAGCSMPSYDRALYALRSWLDTWSGIGHVTVGMARQGYDLQLTRYDEKGWRATFYTTGMEHSPTSATGTLWERTLWSCDAACGVGGAQEGRDGLTVLDSTLSALELPGREAAEVNMKPLNSGRGAVVGELNLKLYLIQLDRCTTYRAGIIDPRPGPRAVRASGRQLSGTDRLSGRRAADVFVGHG